MMETMGKPDKDLNEAMKHICDVMQKRIDDAYKRGIDDGSLDVKQRAEGAYQKGFEDGKAQDGHGCEGCEWDGTPFDVCSKCRNSYENLYKRKESDDEIKVGDEVIYIEHKFIVFATETEEHYASLFDVNGRHASASQSECKKTGRHFDIEKILKEMQT